MTNARSQILRQQQNWAANRKVAVDSSGSYTETLDANLFQPLHRDTLADFQRGSGDELGCNGHRGKMQALHSSSAFAVNVFDYWRGPIASGRASVSLLKCSAAAQTCSRPEPTLSGSVHSFLSLVCHSFRRIEAAWRRNQSVRRRNWFRIRFSCSHLPGAVFLSTTRPRGRTPRVRELRWGSLLPGVILEPLSLAKMMTDFEINSLRTGQLGHDRAEVLVQEK
jgi:hypothetical protein